MASLLSYLKSGGISAAGNHRTDILIRQRDLPYTVHEITNPPITAGLNLLGEIYLIIRVVLFIINVNIRTN
jgi:hypothetical protein